MNTRFAPLFLNDRAHHPALFMVTALTLLLAAPPCLPQTGGIPDAGNPGVPINGAFSGSNVDSVQLNNGNLHIDIPLLDLPGIGIPIHIHFIYDNKTWDYNSNPASDTYTVNQDRTPSFISYPGNVYFSAATTTPIVQCGTQSYPDAYLNHMSFVDEQGTAHPFNVNGYIADSPPCDYAPAPTLMYAADSSGILANRTAGQAVLSNAITKSGTVYTFPANNDVMMEDSNGNKLTAVTASVGNRLVTTVTDTAGRVFTISGDPQYGNQPSSITYTDQNGAPQTITISYTSLVVDTAPLCALEKGFQCVSTVGPSVWVPSLITLPGGYTYSFTFQPSSLADLESLTLPTGGVISWTYGQTDVSGDKVITRTVAANGQTSLWKYNYVMSSTQGPNTSNVVTVTDPLLNDTQYTCTIYAPNPLGLSGTAQLQPCSMTKEQAFTGNATSGTPLVTKNIAYKVTGVVLPQSTTVTWANTGQVAETDISWDSIPNSGFYSGSDNPANDVSRGNVLSRIDYDYGSGSHGVLLSNTQYTYEYQQNAAYTAPNIVDRVYQQSVYNSATATPATLMSQTTTLYDQFNQASVNGQTELTPTSGTTNHDYANFSSSATLRGLPTSVSQYVGPSQSAITTYTDYNDLGLKVVTTDGRANSTTYAYGTENAFLSSTTLPSANGVSHILGEQHDLNTGLLVSQTDENHQQTTYTYMDAMLPFTIQMIQRPDGGTTTNSYRDPNHITTTVTATPSPNEVSATTLDGLGRTSSTVGINGASVDTTYDLMGRVYTVSNPYFSGSTYGVTTYTYDALGRKVQQKQADGTSSLYWCYDNQSGTNCRANASSTNQNDIWVDATDENGNHSQRTYDAMGRITGVMEPNSSNVLTYETDYQYNALNDLITSTQTATPGIVRSFGYDSLSRLTSATNPENGTISYTYDANSNVIKKVDQRAASGTIYYCYDSLDRLITKSYSLPNCPMTSPDVAYSYDTSPITGSAHVIGRLTSESTFFFNESDNVWVKWTQRQPYAYSAVGQVVDELQCVPGNCSGTPNTLQYSYDLAGHMTGSTNGVSSPAVAFTYSYDSGANLAAVIGAINGQQQPTAFFCGTITGITGCPTQTTPAYNAAAQLQNAQLAINPATNQPAITLARTYDERFRPLSETVTGESVAGVPASATVTISGSEQSIGSGGTATPATGTISLTYSASQVVGARPLILGNSITLPDGYHVSFVATANSAVTVANALAAALNTTASPVTAVVNSGGSASAASVVLTTKATGADQNGPIALSLVTTKVTAAPASLSGGGGTTYDTGAVTANINGTIISVGYGQPSTPQTVAQSLATAINGAGAGVTAAAAAGAVTVTANQGGTADNGWAVTLSSASDEPKFFSSPSFSGTSGTLSGGMPGTTGTIYQFSIPQTNGYDPAGNLLSYSDCVPINTGQPCESSAWGPMAYDTLNRLSAAQSSAGPWNSLSLGWTYDALGNRTSQTVTATLPLGYPAPATKSWVYPSNNQATTLTYDSSGAGFVIGDGSNGYAYDPEGRLCAVYNPTLVEYTEYVYDAEGRRVAKGMTNSLMCNPTANYTQKESYVLGQSGEQITEQSGSGAFLRSHVYANGQLLATYVNNSTEFAFNDWLGSKRVVANSDGSVAGACLNLPFGDELVCSGSASLGGHHFTGQIHDQDSGNDYFNARYYSNSTGRFMSPDPGNISGIFHMDTPQSWNGYAYAGNNPLTNTDPTGDVYQVCDANGQNCSFLTDQQFQNEQEQDQRNGEYFQNGQLSHMDSNGSVVQDGTYQQTDVDIPGDPASNAQAANMIGNGGMGMVNGFMKNMAYTAVGGAVLGPLAEAAAGAQVLSELAMVKPLVTDAKLAEIVEELFQATDKVPGGTAGAVRYEAMTGDMLSPAGHAQEAGDIVRQLNTFLKNNPGISSNDQAIAKELIRDLSNSLGGK